MCGCSFHWGGHARGHGFWHAACHEMWYGWGFHRRFETKEERRRRLEEYRDQLKKELEAVEELLKEMGAP
ncbi:MAG: hypothetical protein ACUVTZ_00435 [Armatimonadota bacterium]